MNENSGALGGGLYCLASTIVVSGSPSRGFPTGASRSDPSRRGEAIPNKIMFLLSQEV